MKAGGIQILVSAHLLKLLETAMHYIHTHTHTHTHATDHPPSSYRRRIHVPWQWRIQELVVGEDDLSRSPFVPFMASLPCPTLSHKAAPPLPQLGDAGKWSGVRSSFGPSRSTIAKRFFTWYAFCVHNRYYLLQFAKHSEIQYFQKVPDLQLLLYFWLFS